MAESLNFKIKPTVLKKHLLFLITVFLCSFQLISFAQETIIVRGSVFDNKTKDPLPFATVAVASSYIGVATNEDGEFNLALPYYMSDEVLEVSYVGYTPITIQVDIAMKTSQIIFLDPLDITVGEVVVKSRRISGREILEKSLTKIKNNYYQNPYLLKGFYREVSRENRIEVAIAEASVEVLKSGYNNLVSNEQVRVNRTRKIVPENVQAKSKFNFEGGTYYRNSDDLIKNRISFLRNDHLPYYKYSISRVLGSGNESVIVLSVVPNDSYINSMEANMLTPDPIFNSSSLMYSGEIYIRESDMAIIKVEYWLGNDRLGNTGNSYITKLPKDVTFKLNSVRFLAEYRKVKGKYNLSYTNGELSFRVRGGPFLVSTEYNVFNEFLILDMQPDNIERFDPSTIVGSKDLIHDFDSVYDSNYWMNYNIVMATARMRNIGMSSDDILFRDKVERNLSDMWLNNFNERIHLHTDRNSYLSGETIFFKAYVIEEATGLASRRSNSFYAMLFNAGGEVVDSARFVLREGIGTGSFNLADSLDSGLLKLTAFSSDMQNYTPDLAFVQSIRINNRIAFNEEIQQMGASPIPTNSVDEDVRVNISFFPEGGYLLSGVSNNLGILSLDVNGTPKSRPVVIRDQDRNILDTVMTNNYGIGICSFKPEGSTVYYAYDQSQHTLVPKTFKLPQAKKKGLSLKLLENKVDTLKIKVTSNKGFSQEAYLVLSSGMDILGDDHFTIRDARIIEIPYSSDRGGVATLTLYDDEIPVSERLVLLNAGTLVEASATTEYMAYPAKGKIELKIKLSDKNAKPVMASLSLSVLDSINAIADNYSIRNIIYSLWLKPSLKTELPAGLAEYVASKIESGATTDYGLINSFLLCYGWRKITPLRTYETKPDYTDNLSKDYDALICELLPKNSKRIKRRRGSVSIVDLSRFEIEELQFDKNKLALYRVGREAMTSNIMVSLDDPKDIKSWFLKSLTEKNMDFVNQAKDYSQAAGIFKLPRQLEIEPLKFDKDVIIIDEVVVKGRFIEKQEIKIGDRYNFSNATNSRNGIPEDHPGAKSIISLLQEISSPRRIDHSPLIGEVYYREVIKNPLMANAKILPVLFIVNDIPVTNNYHDLYYLPVEQVLSMRVVIGANAFSFFGERAQGGAVLIYTKSNFVPAYQSTTTDPGFIIVDPLCKVSREFVKPVYDSININEGARLRQTIHWDPYITTDKNGEALIEFFNPGYNSNVVGILQGLTLDGVPIQTRFRYRVIKED